MKQNTPISIRVVQNGYIVTSEVPKHGGLALEIEDSHVFNTAEALAAFVAQFYAENHAPKSDALTEAQSAIQAMVDASADPEHNPAKLTADQIGVSDGWRLLRKSEIKSGRGAMNCQSWEYGIWDKFYFGSNHLKTYRTRVPFGQLDKEGV